MARHILLLHHKHSLFLAIISAQKISHTYKKSPLRHKATGEILSISAFLQLPSLIQEELRTAIEAEILDAAGEVHIAGEDAEALHGADVSKVDDYLVRQ